jgi:energy-coupling factor transport system permease protein
MKKTDPRTMLLIAACFSTMGVLIESTWLLACVFAAAVVFNVFLGARMLTLIRRLRALIWLVVIIAFLQSIFGAQGEPILAIGSFVLLSEGGLLMAANMLLRVGAIIASASIFTLTTSRTMIQGLIQLKVPYELAFMSSVAMRFLPVFSEEFRDTVTAIQLRGVDLKKIPLKEKIRMYSKIITPVVYGAVDKAQKLSYSMELRAFRAYPKRTSRITLRLKAADYFYITLFPLLTAGTLVYYYLYI